MREVITLTEPDFLEISRCLFDKGVGVRFQAKGWSMRPFIKNGDFITVKPIENSSIKTGDVVFYSTAENKVVIHRVIKKYKKNITKVFLIKGDAASGFPEIINVKNVFGKVVEIERRGRTKRLESKSYKVINLFLSGISPFSHRIYPLGSRVKKRGRKIFGTLLKELKSLKE
jgi:signal peptidase I